MLAIERKREILSKLNTNGKVIVTELAKEFGVTEETVRRDLEKLDNEGLASKIYGGAVSKKGPVLELPYNVRDNQHEQTERNQRPEKDRWLNRHMSVLRSWKQG